MNQKAFAIFIGAIMIFSAFAGFILRGGDSSAEAEAGTVGSIETANLAAFGVQGQLVDWRFSSLEDVLDISPQETYYAYWIDLESSPSLTEAARETLPASVGLLDGETIYPTKVSRTAFILFNRSYAEFHWMMPFRVGYQGLMIPYGSFLILPVSSEYSLVMGRPTLFGPVESLDKVLDVLSGSMPADQLTLAYGEFADLQVAGQGSVAGAPLGGAYDEFYLGVSMDGSDYRINAMYLAPRDSCEGRLREIASGLGMEMASDLDMITVEGVVGRDHLKEALALLNEP